MVAFATQVKRRRGTTAQNDAFTGAEGEIVVDTERHELRVHDGVTMGGFKISGSTSLPLLTPMWFDHIANDVSWLRADTFSWQSGDVYVAAYNHLINDLDGKTAQNETIGDITITYYLADDGHKICLPGRESDLVALYNKTGVAWYYILDVINKRFKLPRTKWGFTGLRDTVGGYVEQDVLLPNITGVVTGLGDVSVSGAFARGYRVAGNGGGNGSITADNFNASSSSSVYSGNGTNTLIQPRGTQMYLYFFVGNFEQSAIEQTAGLNAEMFNDLNAHKVIAFQAPTSANGYTWYRKYADGWVEQGVINAEIGTAIYTFNFPVIMQNTNYTVMASVSDALNTTSMAAKHNSKATTGVNVRCTYQASSIHGDIMVCGVAA